MKTNEKLILKTKGKLTNLLNDVIAIQDSMSDLIADIKFFEQYMREMTRSKIYIKEDAIVIRKKIKKLIRDIKNMEAAIPCAHYIKKDAACTTTPATSH